MNSLPIKLRLTLLAVLAGIGMLAMTAIEFSAMGSLESLEDTRYLVADIESDMLMLRRNEKDFLARKDLAYRDKFIANAQSMQDHIAALQAGQQAHGIEAASSEQLQAVTSEYAEKFLELVALQSRIGLNPRDGLYGSLRNAVHQAEELINARNDDSLSKDMLMLRRREKDFMLRMDLKYVDKFNKDLSAFYANLDGSNHPASVRKNIKAAMQQYQQDFHALVDAEREKGLTSKLGVLGAMRTTIHKSEDILAQLHEETAQHISAAGTKHRSWSLVLAGVITLVILVVVAVIAIGIIRPIEKLAQIMSSASREHDLTLRADINGTDEISEMAQTFNRMMGEFEGMIKTVMGSSVQLNTAAADLTAITQAGIASTTRQGLETEQVATAMNEMTATVREVASNASYAADASSTADREVASSRDVVRDNMNSISSLADVVQNTAQTITELSNESANIGTVLSVIREIAEQTNLLALNAAIEAARAGEQGRGFAVVADEVRMLAQRSQQSTQEIQQIIERLQQSAERTVTAMEQGQEKARESVEKAKSVGSSLDQIAQAVASINDMNLQIASAAEEQTAVSEEINRNVVNINQIATETAENSEQTSLTSESLNTLAGEIQGLVSRFKLS